MKLQGSVPKQVEAEPWAFWKPSNSEPSPASPLRVSSVPWGYSSSQASGGEPSTAQETSPSPWPVRAIVSVWKASSKGAWMEESAFRLKLQGPVPVQAEAEAGSALDPANIGLGSWEGTYGSVFATS